MPLPLLLALLLVLAPLHPALAQVMIQESLVRVHVGGLVKHPGVYTLPRGARGVDAVQAAGGIAPGASLADLNLASILEDGQRLEVPRIGAVATAAASTPRPARSARARSRSRSEAPTRVATGRISLNGATVEQFDSLPGIGRSIATEIVRYRTQRGRFRTLDELKEVPGIGDRRFERLSSLLTL